MQLGKKKHYLLFMTPYTGLHIQVMHKIQHQSIFTQLQSSIGITGVSSIELHKSDPEKGFKWIEKLSSYCSIT